ncbi:MAG: hypothetical protein P8165_15145 [Deltaproteobacteria bacterium]
MTKQDSQKISNALAVLNEAAREGRDELNEMFSQKYSDLKSAVRKAEAQLSESAKDRAHRLGEVKDATMERVKDTAREVDRKVHESPWPILGSIVAGALLIGFLLGRKK